MIRRLTGWALEAVERHRQEVLVGWTSILVMVVVLRAWAKPFWHDEIYTILESRLPLGTLWRASRDGLDLSPPLNAALTRLVGALASTGPIASRLPSMIGFWSASILVFQIARLRANAVVGLAAAAILCFTPALFYADEARGYGVTCGCYALALYGWSEAAAGRHGHRNLVWMAAGLAAGVWAHYYVVLAALPIVAGEGIRQWRVRHFERAPWLALAVAAVATLPLISLVAANRAQAATFWTRTRPVTSTEAYSWLMSTLTVGRLWRGLEIVIGLAVIELVRRASSIRSSRRLPLHEITAGLVAVALPAVGVWMGHALGGLLTLRYLTFTTVGFAIVVPLAAWRLTPDNGIGDLVLTLALCLSWLKMAGHTILHESGSLRDPVADRSVLAAALREPGPIVLTGGPSYLQVWFYTPQDHQAQIIYLADPAEELAVTREETVDRGYLVLARWTSVPIADQAMFLDRHDAFRLYRFGPDWLTPTLRARGAIVTPRGRDANGELVDVRLPRPSVGSR